MPDISLFYGDEDYLIEKEIDAIKSGNKNGFSVEKIDGSRSKLNDLLNSINSMPMFGGQRMVIIEDADIEKDDEDVLFSSLKLADPQVKIIFLNHGKADKRTRLYKFLDKNGIVKEFPKLTEWEQDKALAWILNRVKENGKKIESRAAEMLIEMVGLNLRLLDKEIEKISTYLGERVMIGVKDVSDLASTGEADAFALSNSLRAKDVTGSFKALTRLFKDNEDPHMILGMLAKQYRMLLQVKSLHSYGKDQYQIAKELRANPFFVKKSLESASRFTKDDLVKALRLLHNADLKMKSGATPRFTLEMLIPDLCNAG